MQRYLSLYIIILLCALGVSAQERKAENRPYCDLRPLHLGVVVGTHWQDTELTNVGPTVYTNNDGVETGSLITCEQDSWENGFHVGVLGELRINTHCAMRIAPTLYFANRHFVFHNMLEKEELTGLPVRETQDMKTAYIGCDLDFIFAAKRFNNHRPYLMAGVAPMFNLTAKSNDYLQMKKTAVYLELGMGCDFYLPFFKLRPELKFMFGLSNNLNTDHVNDLRDPEMIKYTKSVSKATNKIIALTFYFE